MSGSLSKTDEEAQDGFTVRPARRGEAGELARLMSEVITWSRLSELGQGFMTLLHRHMIGSVHAICQVAERDGDILGYAAWSADTGKFYREFLLRHGLAAAVKLAPNIFPPRGDENIVRGLPDFLEAHPHVPPTGAFVFS